MPSFYAMEDFVEFKGRWYLNGLYNDEGTQLDSEVFTVGKRVPSKLRTIPRFNDDELAQVTLPFTLGIRKAGKPLDFNFADFELPVCKRHVSDLLKEHFSREIQLFPARVGHLQDEFDVLNLVKCVDCIDMENSELELWEEGNDIRPDLAGTPMEVDKLVVDARRVGNRNIFRLQGWDNTIVVSEALKELFERNKVTGVRFSEVTI